jgi:hypothetical protein
MVDLVYDKNHYDAIKQRLKQKRQTKQNESALKESTSLNEEILSFKNADELLEYVRRMP